LRCKIICDALTWSALTSIGDSGRAAPQQRTVCFNHACVARLNRAELRVVTDVGDRRMEAAGIVHRTAYPEVPPKVGYRLTKWGESLCPALDAILTMGRSASERL